MKTIAVVGTGPSLKYEDLDLLYKSKVESISCGRIFLSFEQTKWRPVEIVIGDTDFLEDPGADLLRYIEEDVPILFRATNAMLLATNNAWTKLEFWMYPELITLFPHCGHYCIKGGVEELDPVPTEWHREIICSYGLSGQMAIQRAIQLGAERIILLGFDDDYSIDGPYFDEAYLNERYPEYKIRELNYIAQQTWPFWKNQFEKAGIEIINCSENSVLDIFPRYKLEEVI